MTLWHTVTNSKQQSLWRKEEKYTELVEEIEDNGFVVDFSSVEVGSRESATMTASDASMKSLEHQRRNFSISCSLSLAQLSKHQSKSGLVVTI